MPVFADALPMPSDLPINTIDPTSLSSIGAAGGMTSTQLIIYGLIGLFSIICMWMIFKKAGRKGRESIIPFWNVYIICKIAGKKNRFWIFMILPFIGILWFIISVVFFYLIGESGESVMVIKNLLNWILGIISFIAMIINLVFQIILPFLFAKKFGKSEGFGVGLLFLTPIFLGILAFGKAKYQGENNQQ